MKDAKACCTTCRFHNHFDYRQCGKSLLKCGTSVSYEPKLTPNLNGCNCGAYVLKCSEESEQENEED